jgi:glycosyltransferase domain-containing protein
MSFANSIGMPFKIIVADGGKDTLVPEILSNPSRFHRLNYEYIKFPYDRTSLDFNEKLIGAVYRVRTPFVAMIDDDDFFVVDGLRRSVAFLERHPDYVTCRGRIGRCYLQNPNPEHTFGKDLTVYESTFNDSLEQERAIDRVRTNFSPYGLTYYDVHRTENLRSYFELLQDLAIEDVFTAELLTCFLAVADGKIRREPFWYLVRQSNKRYSVATQELKKANYFERMLSETWAADLVKFFNAVAQSISIQDGMRIDDARRQVKEAYIEYWAPIISACLSAYNKKQDDGYRYLEKSLMLDRTSECHDALYPIYDFLTSDGSLLFAP